MPPQTHIDSSAPKADAPRVFLSYSHDSEEYADRVLALADSLCVMGST